MPSKRWGWRSRTFAPTLPEGPDPDAVAARKGTACKLSPRSRAFQGLELALEGGPPDHPLVAPLGDEPDRPFNRRAAPCALPENASAYQNAIPEIARLMDSALRSGKTAKDSSHQLRTPKWPR